MPQTKHATSRKQIVQVFFLSLSQKKISKQKSKILFFRMQLVYHQPPSEDDLQPAGMDNLTSALDESMDPEKEDYEVFDKRDLMNVVVHSVLCAGIT